MHFIPLFLFFIFSKLQNFQLHKHTIPQLGNVDQEKIQPVQWPDLNGVMRSYPKVKKRASSNKYNYLKFNTKWDLISMKRSCALSFSKLQYGVEIK